MSVSILVASLLLGRTPQATSIVSREKLPVTINAWVARNVAPTDKIQVNLNTRNAPRVHVAAYPVKTEAWLREREWNSHRPAPSGPAIREWDLRVDVNSSRENGDRFFSRQVNLPPMKPGAYLLDIRAEGKSAYVVVNVTNLCIDLRRAPHRTLAWVTDYKSGNVVSGAAIRFFDRAGQLRASGNTGKDGAAIIETGSDKLVAIVQKGADLAGVSTAAAQPDGQLRAHFETDRPVYRPGQTIYFRTILRYTKGQAYVPATGTATIRLRDPRDNPLDESKMTVSPIGTTFGSFRIPQEAMTGPYTISLEVGGQDARYTVAVAAYRKPEFKVDVAPLAKRYLAGEKLQFKVKSSYYFGAPVPQARVRWQLKAGYLALNPVGDEERWFYGGDGNLYPRDTYSSMPGAAEGEAVTDNEGNALITINSDEKASDESYNLAVTVEDGSRRQVQGTASVPVYAAAVRVGISSSDQVTVLGGLIPVTLKLVDLDNHPVGGKARLRLVTQEWVQKEARTRDKILSERTVIVPPTGVLSTNMPTLIEGGVRIDVEVPDQTGRKARDSMYTYVAGMRFRSDRDPDEQQDPIVEVRLDRRTYRPGDPVHAYVTTNNPARPILATLEGNDVFLYKVFPPGAAARTWSFSATKTYSPNVWVYAQQWAKGQHVGANAILPVPDPSRHLKVEAIPDRKLVRPGDLVHVHVRALDASGKPVAAEVALSVVDEAIYAVSPDNTQDPYGVFWGVRGNDVTEFLSMPSEVSGGAYQRSGALAPVRQRFEDTAFWRANVLTREVGSVDVEIPMPGNLTTWRINALATTSDTRVGWTHDSIVATRDLTLRLAAPRLVAQGDRFTLIGTVNNRSSNEVTTEVGLKPTGIDVKEGMQQITIPARSERTVRWTLDATTVPPAGQFTLKAWANGPSLDLSDALEVSVPVVPRGVRETIVAGGVVQKARDIKLDLPSDAIPEGSLLSVRVFTGAGPAARSAADRLFRSARYGSPAAAAALIAASEMGAAAPTDASREALAFLSRTQRPGGWGWWEESPADPLITARVGHALALARGAKIAVYDSMWQAAVYGARHMYDTNNLWENRAQLAATLAELGEQHAFDALDEVVDRGMKLSPYSKIRLAEVLWTRKPEQARKYLNEVLSLVSDGPSSAYLPVGEGGVGWVVTDTETTAELLTLLATTGESPDLQSRLATYLILNDGWRSADEDAAVVRALTRYAVRHPSASHVGTASMTLDGEQSQLKPSTVEESASIELPPMQLPNGVIHLDRTGEGEAFYVVTLRYYRNQLNENSTGVRVLRRYEVKNPAGVWTEVDRVIHPGEPVRCTVVVWGDDRSDAVRVNEPIPAGFEFVDADEIPGAEQDVRDGAVVHYLVNGGTPLTFRYYLRAESDGKLVALPAIAEYLRRPLQRGQSGMTPLEVHP